MAEKETERQKESKFFEKFMGIMEVLYAVLLTWGFANIAQSFHRELAYCLTAIVAGLVLIRFFFAPAHNLYHIAVESRAHGAWYQRMVFYFDIPMLILHSFIFYRMCFHVAIMDYTQFYYFFFLLLLLNIIWLISIELRLSPFARKSDWKHFIWIYNNSFFVAAAALLLIVSRWWPIPFNTFPNYWVYFGLALANCLIDFYLSAPYYMGFCGE